MGAAGDVADGKIFGGAEIDQRDVGQAGGQFGGGYQVAGIRKICLHFSQSIYQ